MGVGARRPHPPQAIEVALGAAAGTRMRERETAAKQTCAPLASLLGVSTMQPDGASSGFDASMLVIPDYMHDYDNPSKPHASRGVRQTHVEFAIRDEYHLDTLLPLSSLNGMVSEQLTTLMTHTPGGVAELEMEAEQINLRNDAHVEHDGKPASIAAEVGTAERTLLKKAFSTELYMSLAARTTSRDVIPFLLICLSLLALKSGVPEDTWLTLRFMGVLVNKEWITAFALDVSSQLVSRLRRKMHGCVRFVVGDNCDYQTRNVQEHTDKSGEYLHTINWLSVVVSQTLQAVLPAQLGRGAWRRPGFSRFSVRELFDPDHTDTRSLKEASWRAFMSQTQAGDDILRHPHVPKPEQTELLFEEPLLDAGTAAYADVDKWLVAVRNLFCFLVGITVGCVAGDEQEWTPSAADLVLVVGDQQTWSRMLWLKLMHPERYSWMLPLPGEFHFTVHLLMAIHILWWHTIIFFAVNSLDSHKTIKQGWTSVEQYKYYDHFYQLTIRALALYMAEVVPPAILAKPALLLQMVQGNAAAVHAVQFLFEFGFPWLNTRQAIRSNNSRVLDVMWPLSYHWFGPTGKTNYRIMAVIVTYIRYAMIAPLSCIWTVMRTGSLSAHAGFNVAWDFVNERFNRMCKQTLGTNISRERILHYLPVIQAFRYIWPRFLCAMGRGDTEGSDYSHITQSDLDTLVEAFRKALGQDFDSLCKPCRKYAFHVDITPSPGGDGCGSGGGGARGSARGGRGRAGQKAPAKRGRRSNLQQTLAGAGHTQAPPDPTQVVRSYAFDGSIAAGVIEEGSDMNGMKGDNEYEIDRVLSVKGRGAKRQYLIRWKGYDETEDTWEKLANLANASEAVKAFEDREARRRKKVTGADGSDGEDDAQSSDGEDESVPYEVRQARWFRDVTDILKRSAPPM